MLLSTDVLPIPQNKYIVVASWWAGVDAWLLSRDRQEDRTVCETRAEDCHLKSRGLCELARGTEFYFTVIGR